MERKKLQKNNIKTNKKTFLSRHAVICIIAVKYYIKWLSFVNTKRKKMHLKSLINWLIQVLTNLRIPKNIDFIFCERFDLFDTFFVV